MKKYKTPQNTEDYWNIINIYWNDLNHILNVYLPTYQNKWIDGSKIDKSLQEYLLELKNNKNNKLVRALNAAYFFAPEENSGEWFHKSWNILCDLIYNEDHCLNEEKED